MTQNTRAVHIRPAELADAQEIANIYNVEVLESTATLDLVPRSVDEQRQWLAERSGAHAVLVSINHDEVVTGFASLSPFRSRPAYSTTVENSVYVARDQRRQGIAKALLEELILTARSHGFHAIIARIASTQEPSINLHKSVGFEMVGVERQIGRKFNRWLDVTVMQLLL